MTTASKRKAGSSPGARATARANTQDAASERRHNRGADQNGSQIHVDGIRNPRHAGNGVVTRDSADAAPTTTPRSNGRLPKPSNLCSQAYLIAFQRGCPCCGSSGDMDLLFLDQVKSQLEFFAEEHRLAAKPALDIWLDSPGGDIHAVYRLYRYLRSKFDRLRVVVPSCAKSAATLLAISADELYMAGDAELGPLDVQIPHPGRHRRTVSGLDITGSLDVLTEHAGKLLLDRADGLRRFGRRPAEAVREASRFVAQLLAPAIGRLDPTIIRATSRELEIAQMYVRRVLTDEKRQAKEPPAPGAIAERLVKEFPGHDFVIDLDEIRRWGLPAQDIEAYTQRHSVLAALEAFEVSLLDGCPSLVGEDSFVRVWSASEIKQAPWRAEL